MMLESTTSMLHVYLPVERAEMLSLPINFRFGLVQSCKLRGISFFPPYYSLWDWPKHAGHREKTVT